MRLIVHADANSDVGAGHLMRCASLAETWLDLGLGPVSHCGEITIPFAKNRLASLGIDSLDEACGMEADSILVVDNYDWRVRQTTGSGRWRLKVLVDDLGDVAPGFDLIWNPNAYAAHHLYQSFSGMVISGYVPVRRGLPTWRQGLTDVAVSLGARIPPDWMIAAIDRWARVREVRLVTGKAPWTPTSWTAVTADDPWKVFSQCAMILTAGGLTVWEAAHVGIPACVVISAPNQCLIGDWARSNGVPVIDLVSVSGSAAFYANLNAKADNAAVLPKVDSGAAHVARTLYGLAAR